MAPLRAGQSGGAGDALVGVGDGDDEGDRAEAFLAVGGRVGGIDGEDQRRGAASLGERRAVADDPARGARAAATRSSVAGLAMAPQTPAARAGSASRRVDGGGDARGDLVEGLVALVGVDAAARDEDVLRRRAHLAGIEREREGDVGAHRREVVGCRR